MKYILAEVWEQVTTPGTVRSPLCLGVGLVVSWAEVEAVLRGFSVVATAIILAFHLYRTVRGEEKASK